MDSRTIARRALEIGAVKLDTKNFFQDRRNYKPVFQDISLFLFDPQERKSIRDGFIDLLDYDYDVLASTSSLGASITTSIADYLGKPFVFLRDDRDYKYHLSCLNNTKELKEKRVVIIEDWLGTGSSILRATCALRNFGIISDKFHSIFDYNYKSKKELFNEKRPFNEFGLKLFNPLEVKSLFDLDTLLEVAVEDKSINCEEKEDVLLWRDNYNKWEAVHRPISRYP